MKFISTSILLFLSLVTYSQDTVYCYSYQKGIITHTLESKITGYKLTPIDNPDLEIGLTKKEVRKIKYTSGKEFVNDNYGDTDVIPLSTEPTTGKIYYSEVVEFKGAKVKDLFNAIKRIPEGMVKYSLISSDDTEYTFQKYVGSFSVRFAGDPYTVFFNLLLKFKEGKIKYEYSDFVTSFVHAKARQSFNPFVNGVNTSIENGFKSIDKLYAGGARHGDQTKFWSPISNNINDSIKVIKKLCDEASGKKDDW